VDVARIRGFIERAAVADAPRLALRTAPRQVQTRSDAPALLTAQTQTAARQERRSVGRVILGAAVGTVGGFFAGGYLGAKIEGNDCNCDDPGFKGFLIGAPIGAVAGGILGGLFLF
jgi:hypothetical protein